MRVARDQVRIAPRIVRHWARVTALAYMRQLGRDASLRGGASEIYAMRMDDGALVLCVDIVLDGDVRWASRYRVEPGDWHWLQ